MFHWNGKQGGLNRRFYTTDSEDKKDMSFLIKGEARDKEGRDDRKFVIRGHES